MTPLIVVSHYNAWPTDQLVALLDQIASVPAGMPFDLCIVVNQERPDALVLPERHRRIPILYRENTGYNIGAWDHGWRLNADRECYLFLQEECRIVRPNWLSAHHALATKPEVGLVGESLQWAGMSWDRLRRQYRTHLFDSPVDGTRVSYPVGIEAGLQAAGVPKGSTGAHLQSLVLCMRRSVLEAIGGFSIGHSYGEAVLAEVLTSKRVAALGLQVREVGPGAFRYILHPQWHRRQGRLKAAGRAIMRRLPVDLAEYVRSATRLFASS